MTKWYTTNYVVLPILDLKVAFRYPETLFLSFMDYESWSTSTVDDINLMCRSKDETIYFKDEPVRTVRLHGVYTLLFKKWNWFSCFIDTEMDIV